MPYKKRLQRLEYQRNYQPFRHEKLSKSERKLRIRQIKVAQFLRGRESRLILIQEHGGKCEKCGVDDPGVLAFHHTDPATKKNSISTMLTSGLSIGKARKEAAKCILLCANCHVLHHVAERHKRTDEDAKNFRSRTRAKGKVL